MLQSVEECYRVLQGVTECYGALPSFTECYRVLQSITKYYRELQSITENYRVLQSIRKYYKDQSRASTWTNFWACFLYFVIFYFNGYKNKTKIYFSPLATYCLLKKMSSFQWELVQGESKNSLHHLCTTSILAIFFILL